MQYGLHWALSVTLILPAVVFAQTVRLVPAEYATIQQAIDASVNGDAVLVSAGTYLEKINLGGKHIAVKSVDGPEATIIDATYLGSVVTIGAGATRDTLLEGFTITRGKNNSAAAGIAIRDSSPTIRNNIITGNLGGGSGNGIYAQNASALIVGNRILANHNNGETSGGGGGGGIYVGANPCSNPPAANCGTEIRNNLIEGNTTDNFTYGGGILLFASGPAKIVANVIRNNRSFRNGGGIAIYNSADALIENNLILGNTLTASDSKGGGVSWLVPSGNRGPFLINNTIVANASGIGSGVYADGYDVAARMINNLVIAVGGVSAVECGGLNDPFPPIIDSNDVVTDGGAVFAGLCAGSLGTQGNISVAPMFVAAGDYRLSPGSAGVDVGNNAFSTQTVDLLGAARIVDGDGVSGAQIDVGAYETGDTIFVGNFDG